MLKLRMSCLHRSVGHLRNWRLALAAALLLGITATIVPVARANALPLQAATNAGFEGFGLGVAVMIALGLALLYALALVVLGVLGRSVPVGPAWITYLVPALCVFGLAVAFYLSYVETQRVAAICGPVGDCNTVQASPYARLFGILPIGVLGMLGYLAMLAAWVIGRLSAGRMAELALFALFGFALFGVLFSLYLTYLELYVILAVCAWCLTSAVLMAVLLVLSSGPAMSRLSLAGEDVGA